MLDGWESYDEKHDPERATPSGYCRCCGGEIYSDDELYEFDGLCAECWTELWKDTEGDDG